MSSSYLPRLKNKRFYGKILDLSIFIFLHHFCVCELGNDMGHIVWQYGIVYIKCT